MTCDACVDPRYRDLPEAPDPDDHSLMASGLRAAREVARWPSWKARRCTCASRRQALLEDLSGVVESIASWIAGDGSDAARVALADGVREGSWVRPADLAMLR